MSQFAYYASSKKCNNNNNNNVNESTCSSLKIGDKVDVFTNSFIRKETEEKNHFCEAFVKEVNPLKVCWRGKTKRSHDWNWSFESH